MFITTRFVVLATAVTLVASGCGAPAAEELGTEASELSRVDRDPTLEVVDHAAFAEAQAGAARDAGVQKWRLGAARGALVVDGLTESGKGAWKLRISQADGVTTVTAGRGRSMSFDAKGNLLASTLTTADLKMFRAVAEDFDSSKVDRMEVAYRFWKDFFRAAATALACATAVGQGGLNPVSNAGCVLGVADIVLNSDDDKGGKK
jgi:hypothetical protein